MAKKSFLLTFLKGAQPLSLAKNVLTIGYDPELADLGVVDNSTNHAILQTKLAELGFPGCQVKFVVTEMTLPTTPEAVAAPAVAAPSPAPVAPKASATPRGDRPRAEGPTFNAETFKNDPLIQKALETFKGQIVNVVS